MLYYVTSYHGLSGNVDIVHKELLEQKEADHLWCHPFMKSKEEIVCVEELTLKR